MSDPHEERRQESLAAITLGVERITEELGALRTWLASLGVNVEDTVTSSAAPPPRQSVEGVSVTLPDRASDDSIFLTRLVDREVLLSAVDVCIFLALHSAHLVASGEAVGAQQIIDIAHTRLGISSTEQTKSYFTSRLYHVKAMLQKASGEAEIISHRITILDKWRSALSRIISEITDYGAEPAVTVLPSANRPCTKPFGPTPGYRDTAYQPRTPIARVLDTPECIFSPKGESNEEVAYGGAVFLGVTPLEYAQTLFRRVTRRKRERDGQDDFGLEEKRIKERLDRAQTTAKELALLVPLSTQTKAHNKKIKVPQMWTIPRALRASSLLESGVTNNARTRNIQVTTNVATMLERQRKQTSAKQEKEANKIRASVAKTLNKAVMSFWDHCSGIRKKATKDWVAFKKQEVLETKKQQLLDEAEQIAQDLSEQMKGTGTGMANEENPDDPADTGVNDIPTPAILDGGGRKLRAYQQTGLNWLVAMFERGVSGILADEMGLGKTIQTIALLAHLASHEKIWGPHLVIVPTSVMLNWEIEFRRWAPGMKLVVYYGSQDARRKKRLGWTKPDAFDVCITSYQLVMQDAEHFKRVSNWKYMILDEAHMIKNWRSKKWQILQQFKTMRRLLLSGTPLQNNLMEIWSLLRFLLHDNPLLASDSNFNSWFNSPMAKMLDSGVCDSTVVQQLHTLLRPFVLRRLKRQVESQMPKKIEKVVHCRLSKRQRTLYDEYMRAGPTQQTLRTGGYVGVIGILMSLRKVCNHPSLFEPRPISSPFCMYNERNCSLYTVHSPKGPELHLPHIVTSIPSVLSNTEICLTGLTSSSVPLYHIRDAKRKGKGVSVLPTSPEEVKEMYMAAEPPGYGDVLEAARGDWTEFNSAVESEDGVIGGRGRDGGADAYVAARGKAMRGYLAFLHRTATEARSARAQRAAMSQRLSIIAFETKQPSLDRFDLGLLLSATPSDSMHFARRASSHFIRTTVTHPDSPQHRPTHYDTRFAQTLTLRPLAYRRRPLWAKTACYIRGASSRGQSPQRRLGPPKQASDRCLKTFRNGEIAWKAETDEPIEVKKPKKKEKTTPEDETFLFGVAPSKKREVLTISLWGEGDYLCPDWSEVMCDLQHRRTAAVHSRFLWHTGVTMAGMKNTALVAQRYSDMYIPRATAPPHEMITSARSEAPPASDFAAKMTRDTALCGQFPLLALPDSRLLEYDCGKLQALAALLPVLKSQGHRVLIFTQMSRVLDILEAFLSMKGHVYLRLDGSTKIEDRQYKMELFNTDERYFVFILSTRSGGVGINLTGADTVIFYDSDWNPAMDLQAQDRCHRIGQTRDVTVYRLISKHTVEENILMKARQKRVLENVVIRAGGFGDASNLAAETGNVPQSGAKAKVLEFFHHLSDDEIAQLKEAEKGVEITGEEQTNNAFEDPALQGNQLLEFEEGVDREAYQRYEVEGGDRGG